MFKAFVGLFINYVIPILLILLAIGLVAFTIHKIFNQLDSDKFSLKKGSTWLRIISLYFLAAILRSLAIKLFSKKEQAEAEWKKAHQK